MSLHSPSLARKPLKVLIAMGTRPEIIKQAPTVWAGQQHPAIEVLVCHSGQHTDLADPMLEYFQIQPDINLDLMGKSDSLASLVGGGIQASARTLLEHEIDVVVVQGDTATTTAMALAGFYSRVPVVHVEAGLRTGDLQSPWPEELNRRIATLATSLHCAPTKLAADKLRDEGVAEANIAITGNPVVDALKWTVEDQLQQNTFTERLVVLTAHRRENFGEPLEDICEAVLELTETFTDHRFVFVTHPNPNAGPKVKQILDGNSSIELAKPMSYPEFIRLMAAARLIISDSGGIQEEAPTLGVPLLVTRESTERPEVITCGAAELVGTDRDRIVRRATQLLSDEMQRQAMISPQNPFGNGHSGKRIIEEIVSRFSEPSKIPTNQVLHLQ